MCWLRYGVSMRLEMAWLAVGNFWKRIELSVCCNGLATEEPKVPWMLQTLVICWRHCKIMILILPAARVRHRGLPKVVYYYFFIHLWVISSSCASHMNGCAGKLHFRLPLLLWRMFTIYLWKHCNNKTLYIAFQFAVRADKIFLSRTELHTLGDSVGPSQNNKTLQRKAGTVQIASDTSAPCVADFGASKRIPSESPKPRTNQGNLGIII